jgi:hypothetical protein
MIVVLDINGVIADVRKHEAPTVEHREADVVLPNRQRAYMHPSCSELFEWLSAADLPVVMFTSRVARNA